MLFVLIRIASSRMSTHNKGLKNGSETAMINEPSVFEPLKVYCASFLKQNLTLKSMQVIKLIKNSVELKFE